MADQPAEGSVRAVSPKVTAMAHNWTLVEALMGGTHAMRAAGRAYLPQWPAEDDASYDMRLKTATLFPAYARTVAVLTGKPFSKPVTIEEDVPARLKPWLADVDLQHRDVHSFAADVCQEALAYGLCGILVDCPPSKGARTVADEAQAGIRPYLVHIRHGQILGWRTVGTGASRMLSQLRLLEVVEEDDGPFATKSVEQVRVLEPGRWSIYRKQAVQGLDQWVLYDEGLTTLEVIPFVPVYGKRLDMMVGEPPMIELAHANVEHWQSKSDQQTILHVARVPILFAKGLGDSPIAIGAGSFIQTGSAEADVKYVEHTGKAIEAGRVSLLDLEDRMRQTGAELLVIKPGNVTVAQTLADNEPAMCDLQRITQEVEDSLDQALDLMAAWVKLPEGGHISIYRDFGAATLAEASAELLAGMEARGALTRETLLLELKRRGILGPDVDVEEEVQKAPGLPDPAKPAQPPEA